jgi:hypothetical protein
MRALQRAAAIAVAAIVIVAIVVLVLGAAGAPIGRGPNSTASPGPPAETAGATATPTPTSDRTPTPADDDLLATLAQIEQQVIAIRGLPAAEIGPPDLITRSELAGELERIFDVEYPPDERARDNAILRAFGLLDPEQDVAELQLQLLGDQVLGFYDDTEKRMVVVTDAGLNAEAKLTYAHEYVHALQDAAFGLSTLETDAVGEDDRSLARISLIEGDATVTMLSWALAHLTPEELLEIGSTVETPDMTGIPSWMVNQLQFPYTTGQLWVTQLAGNDPLNPDFAEVDAAFADPPDSTSQVIHIDKWYARERPVVVDTPDLAGALGDDAEEVGALTAGEGTIGIVLEHFGVARSAAVSAAQGWAGDRAVITGGPGETFALVWILAWESGEAAAEFVTAYDAVVAALPFPATVRALDGDRVLVAHASDMTLLRRAVEAGG